MDRKTILAIVDGHSGGLKGLELMTELVVQGYSEIINPVTFFDEIEAIIGKEIPELGFLRYSHQISDNMLREKAFIYRKELTCATS